MSPLVAAPITPPSPLTGTEAFEEPKIPEERIDEPPGKRTINDHVGVDMLSIKLHTDTDGYVGSPPFLGVSNKLGY